MSRGSAESRSDDQDPLEFAWWLAPYLCVLTLLCWCIGRDMNMAHVDRCIDRAARFKTKEVPWQ